MLSQLDNSSFKLMFGMTGIGIVIPDQHFLCVIIVIVNSISRRFGGRFIDN